MRGFALAVAAGVLFAAGSASAQDISGIDANAGSSFSQPSFECLGGGSCFYDTPLGAGAGRYPPAGGPGGAVFDSFVTVGPTAIEFESSNVVSQGDFSSFTSSSTVSFVFQNDTGKSVDFHSEITPQGLGMYLADTSGGCLFTNDCHQVSDLDYQFQDIDAFGEATTGVLGGVGFSFDIFDGEDNIYTLSGSLLLVRQVIEDSEGLHEVVQFLPDFGNADAGPMSVLKNFKQDTVDNDYSARTYSWDATSVVKALAPGEHFIQYQTRVTTFTNADCYFDDICLIAFGGFGDPVGRGGGISASSLISPLDHNINETGLITSLNFQPQTFKLPTFDGYHLVFNRSGTVPEPGTWALMIAGFGLTGAALRRRRIPAHI